VPPLGLPPVRQAKARGKNKGLPSCAYWPWIVRPKDYYQGAFIPPEKGQGREGKNGKPGTAGNVIDRLIEAARNVGGAAPEEMLKGVARLRRGDSWELPPCDFAKAQMTSSAVHGKILGG
jgi:hypothetical protein